MYSPFRILGPPIEIPLGYLDIKIKVGAKEPSKGAQERLSGKRSGTVYGRKGMEQVCSLNNIMGGGLWSFGGISQIIFQFGKGFIIDFDRRTM
jgi:hypothetical protein